MSSPSSPGDAGNLIANGERENRSGRTEQSLQLVFTALTIQHRTIADLYDRLELVESELRKTRQPW